MTPHWVIALAVLAALAGCSGGSGSPRGIGPGPGGAGTTHAALVAKAALRPCPASSSTTVSGGLPDVTLPCLGAGPAVHLAGLTGTPTVVNLWGSWCEPCQAEMRYLSSAYDTDRRAVGFLGVDIVDQADSALDFDAHVRPPVHYPSVFDEDREAAIGLHVDSPPYTVFVSAAGRIVHAHHGAYTSTAQLQHDIAAYLHVTT